MKPSLLSFFSLFIGLLLPVSLQGQNLLWDVDFKFGFDNREYSQSQNIPSGTHFGANCIPKVGLGFEERHSIYVGMDFNRHFGKINPSYSAKALLYYQYAGDHLFINAGAFPSKNRKGYYPYAFQGEYRFFDNVHEGALISYTDHGWLAEATANWTGLQQEDNRERFLVSAFLQYQNIDFPYLYPAVSFMMHHYACSKKALNVVDNVWLFPYIGVDLSSLLLAKMKLNGKFGYIQTFQNDRRTETGYVRPGGFNGELTFEYKGFGVRNLLYLGKNLQPFFESEDGNGMQYGTDLYLGSQFYGTRSGVYDRVDLYYTYHLNDMLNLSVISAQHYDGYHWNWQQLVKMTVNLNNFNFKKKK